MKTLTRYLLLGMAAMAAPAFAQVATQEPTSGKLNQRYWIQLGAFRPSIDSHIQVDHPQTGAAGTSIDFEDTLGLADKETLPTLLLGARLGERWRMEFEHLSLKRNSTETLLTGDVVFDDTTYNASASLASEFDSKVSRLSVGYSLYRTPEAEAGVALGLHVTSFKIALEGQGSVNGGPVSVRRASEEKTLPLPTLGAYGTYAFAPDWAASARADLLYLKVGDYKGSLLNLQANVYYRFNPHLALGLGYRLDDYKLKATKPTWTGKLEYRFSGPQLVLDAGF